jgi:hypothetical protein
MQMVCEPNHTCATSVAPEMRCFYVCNCGQQHSTWKTNSLSLRWQKFPACIIAFLFATTFRPILRHTQTQQQRALWDLSRAADCPEYELTTHLRLHANLIMHRISLPRTFMVLCSGAATLWCENFTQWTRTKKRNRKRSSLIKWHLGVFQVHQWISY